MIHVLYLIYNDTLTARSEGTCTLSTPDIFYVHDMLQGTCVPPCLYTLCVPQVVGFIKVRCETFKNHESTGNNPKKKGYTPGHTTPANTSRHRCNPHIPRANVLYFYGQLLFQRSRRFNYFVYGPRGLI